MKNILFFVSLFCVSCGDNNANIAEITATPTATAIPTAIPTATATAIPTATVYNAMFYEYENGTYLQQFPVFIAKDISFIIDDEGTKLSCSNLVCSNSDIKLELIKVSDKKYGGKEYVAGHILDIEINLY